MLKKVLISNAARADILEQYAYFLVQASEEVSEQFLECVRQSIERIGELPRIGTLKEFKNSSLKGIRSWPILNFKSIRIYYLEKENQLHVVRVLHGKTDIATTIKTIKIYSDKRKAEFLLSNAIDLEDYQAACKTVREMGLDPQKIPHKRHRG